MNLRERLKNETKLYHKALEDQYPFNELISSKSTACFEDALKCFKLLFYPFLKRKQEVHPFYQQVFKALEKFPVFNERYFLEPQCPNKLLHLEYLFLGSRMGNEILVKKSTSLKNFEYREYFEISLDPALWKGFLEKLSKVHDTFIQDQIVEQVKEGFVELRNYGKLLERAS